MEGAGLLGEFSGTPGSDAAPSARPFPAHKERGAAPRILVVEDDPWDLATVVAVLNDAGYRVHPAPNASLALRFLAGSTPDLILMDVGLPDKSGFELCRAVKSRDELADVPVIFVSGADRLSDRMTAFSAGAVDYIAKPFESAELLARIRTHLSLRALQLDLEVRVRERTAELAAACSRLSASEERYRRITETITDYVFQVKVQDGRPGDPTHGPGCVAVTGYTPEELARDPELWPAMVVPEDRPAVIEQARAVLAGECFTPIEHRIVRKDGAMRWVRNTPVPQFGPDGSLVACDGLIQDITERRALETRLIQGQTMESLGRLAGGIAHDFNNLLTAIIGNAQLAQGSLPTDEEEARASIDEIVKAANRATSLTRQLLDFARQRVVSAAPVNIGDIVRESAPMLRRLVCENVEIETLIEPDLGLVEADPGQLQRLLVNLVVNSGDAMPDGGRLVIRASNMTLSAEAAAAHPDLQPGPYAVLSVSDTGIGMSAEVMSHLFEPFFTTKEQGKGTGLGLATSHGIVKQLGGDFEVESEPGIGTTFRIILPLTEPPAALPAVAAPPALVSAHGETVLVVEDEQLVRRLIVSILRTNGYRVLEAADGRGALEIIESHGPQIDLMVSDVVLPGLSGRQLAVDFGARFPNAKLLLVSGYLPADIDQWLHDGPPIPFLAKPFSSEALIRKVREVLDGRVEMSGDRTTGGADLPAPDVHLPITVD
jgi:two-component system cell cycle sensor histidine kinase/response regulator CckA